MAPVGNLDRLCDGVPNFGEWLLFFLLLWFLLPLDRNRFQIGPRSYLLGLRVLREEVIRAGRVPIWRDMPEDLATVVRIINMAADGRALAGDADLDGAPVFICRICAG